MEELNAGNEISSGTYSEALSVVSVLCSIVSPPTGKTDAVAFWQTRTLGGRHRIQLQGTAGRGSR